MLRLWLSAALALGGALTPAAAESQSVADFYRGKTIQC